MQTIIEGITQLHNYIQQFRCNKFMIVVDASFPFLSIKREIDNLSTPLIYYNDFTPNPLYEQVCNGIDVFLEEHCDGIIAIGGGSCIDVAKCIKLGVTALDGKACLIPPQVLHTAQLKTDSLIPFIAIPTTAGTGSESTHNAVIYYDGAKQTVTHNSILPDIALLEPGVLETLPLYQKKCTMMDALCQGIESWWSINSTEESMYYSQLAIKLITHNWHNYILNNDKMAAHQVMLAANYAGRAINIAQTTAAHAMSYKITSMFNLPHGHAVAVCLPEIWAFMIKNTKKCTDPRGGEYLKNVFVKISQSLGVDTPNAAIRFFQHMMDNLQLARPLSHNKASDISILTKMVNPIRLKNTPIKMEAEDISSIYNHILQ